MHNERSVTVKVLTQDGWRDSIAQSGAIINHESGGDHPILRSGVHTDTLVHAGLFLQDPRITQEVGVALAQALYRYMHESSVGGLFGGTPNSAYAGVDMVIGVPDGGTVLAVMVALAISSYKAQMCPFGIAKKIVHPDGTVSFDLSGIPRGVAGRNVLLVEDVVTTGATSDALASAIVAAGGTVLPCMLALWNRNRRTRLRRRVIIPLVHEAIPAWKEKSCPLCARGSRAVNMKVQGKG